MKGRDIFQCTVGTITAAAVALSIVMGINDDVKKPTPEDDQPRAEAPIGDTFETTTQSLSPHGMPAAAAGTPAIPPQLRLIDD